MFFQKENTNYTFKIIQFVLSGKVRIHLKKYFLINGMKKKWLLFTFLLLIYAFLVLYTNFGMYNNYVLYHSIRNTYSTIV